MSRLQDLDFRQGIEIPDNGRSIRGRLDCVVQRSGDEHATAARDAPLAQALNRYSNQSLKLTVPRQALTELMRFASKLHLVNPENSSNSRLELIRT